MTEKLTFIRCGTGLRARGSVPYKLWKSTVTNTFYVRAGEKTLGGYETQLEAINYANAYERSLNE